MEEGELLMAEGVPWAVFLFVYAVFSGSQVESQGKKSEKLSELLLQKPFLVRRLPLRYQSKGLFCRHTFFEAQAASVVVCLGYFSVAEPFERADGIIG